MFGRNKFEKRIINDLECPCYKIVGNTKYFANEEKQNLKEKLEIKCMQRGNVYEI